ncbi:MAG TPA: amino acid synthesis family protein [Verrucomicrobiae bacterium]|nr:amino acid synthesis family protein [Verrucomicrobiae bacterium]
MPKVEVRKFATVVEEIIHEGGPPAAKPFKQGACLAVIRNPFAGRYEPDIQPFMKDLEPLGAEMAKRLISAMGVKPKEIEAYGKGAIVGTAGEIEHGALWHAPGGYGMRDVLGGTKAIVPSTKKVGGAGARLDVPLAHINAAYVRSHFGAMEVGLPDAPREDEIVFILTMSTGARVHDRAGGLKASEIKGEDGLR